MRNRKVGVIAALCVAGTGVAGLALLATPAGAGPSPSLPPVGAEQLVQSVMQAKVPALGGTVTVDNELGLPALPQLRQLASGTTTVRIWSDGQGRGRVALPDGSSEQTYVDDGTTLWHYDSSRRTVSTEQHGSLDGNRPMMADPAGAAAQLVAAVRATSTVSVDGTAEVAGRAAYELVLTPAPTERTLLREVRVAVDAAARVPLRLTVLADGSAAPVLQVGFTDLTVGPQDAGLFHFTVPPGVTVEKPGQDGRAGARPGDAGTGPKAGPLGGPLGAGAAGDQLRTVGDGWDTVLVGTLPAGVLNPAPGSTAPGSGPQTRPRSRDDELSPTAIIQRVGTPINGSFGSGWVISTKVATAIVTTDGRVAVGAVPQQVLVEALQK